VIGNGLAAMPSAGPYQRLFFVKSSAQCVGTCGGGAHRAVRRRHRPERAALTHRAIVEPAQTRRSGSAPLSALRTDKCFRVVHSTGLGGPLASRPRPAAPRRAGRPALLDRAYGRLRAASASALTRRAIGRNVGASFPRVAGREETVGCRGSLRQRTLRCRV